MARHTQPLTTDTGEGDENVYDRWDFTPDESQSRGLALLGIMLGMFVTGMSAGMALPGNTLKRVVVATIGVVTAWACLRWARRLKSRAEELATEEAHVRAMGRWQCTSARFPCEDPEPHVHRGDLPFQPAAGTGDKVYA